MSKNVIVSATKHLRAANAVAAILVREDGGYVMQLRDDIPGIFYPHHWGCFGGAVDPGERPLRALKRELSEELEFRAEIATEFTRFHFDLRCIGQQKVYRIYFTVPVSDREFSRFVLHEGARFKTFTSAEVLRQPRVTPYDAFATWLHISQSQST